MLSIHWIQDVDYYLNQATADYYFRPGEPPGQWWGSGAKTLGLCGEVNAEQLKALCQGRSPAGEALIQNAGAADHQQAWDLTFSAPKSVSVFWSQAPRRARLKIRRLHYKAIKAALKYLHEVALLTRRGKGGTIRERCQPIVAVFEHGSNRELEPQLHSHCVLVNVAGRIDGTYGTILSDPFYKHKLTAGAIYRTELGHLLRNELGLKIERQDKAFAIVGVPQQLVDHHSTRSKQIKNQLNSKGVHSAKAAAAAALDTRKSKNASPPPRGELFQRWQETNRRFGFTEANAERLLNRVAAVVEISDLKNHITQAIGDLLETESYFSEQKLIRQVAINAIDEGSSADQVIDQVKSHLVQDSSLVALGMVDHESQFTTQEMMALEKELLTAIDQGKSDTSHVVRTSAVEQILNRELPLSSNLTEDETLRNQEQRNAIRQLTTQRGNVQVMEGMAGTGKTYTLKVATQAWKQAGYRVVGMALSAVAAGNLQEGAGIESETIALRLAQLDGIRNLARHHQRQLKRLMQGKRTYAYNGSKFTLDRNTILVVDEAAMVGTRQIAKLIKRVRKAGAKLVLVGDRRQLQPIDAGAPFPAIADRTGKADLQHVVRQKLEPDDPNPDWHRQAGKLIAAGHVAQAIKLFKERGRLTVQTDREQAMLSIVRDWSVKGMSNPDDHVILAGTRVEVAELNTACQSARLNAGMLGTDYVVIGDQHIRIGDAVICTENSRIYHVKNGNWGIVQGFNRLTKTIAIRLNTTQKDVFLPYKTYPHMQLGYAMTTHKAQGATVPSLYVLLGGPMQDRHLSYVQNTRACESTRLYVDKHNAGPDLKHLLNQMAKPRPKRLAHDIIPPNKKVAAPPPALPDKTIHSPDGPRTKPPATKSTKPKSKTRSTNDPPKKLSLDTVRIEELLTRLKATHGNPDLPKKTSHHSDQAKPPLPKPPKPESKTPPPSNSLTDFSFDVKAFEELLAQLRATNSNTPKRKVRAAKPPVETQQTTSAEASSTNLPIPAIADVNARIPSRDILNLSHVSVGGTMDRSVLKAAVERYGRLPGGIVVEGEATCDFPLHTLAIDPTSPGTLVINSNLRFDSGLSGEEVALLWQAILLSNQPTDNFGALNQTEAIGVDNDTIVASTMMKADNVMGGLVYGYDSQFSIIKCNGLSYPNAFLNEAFLVTSSSNLYTACFNYLFDVKPQFFLKVIGVRLGTSSQGVVTVKSNQVQAVIGVSNSGGVIANTTPAFGNVDPSVKDRFPCTYQSFQHFVENFVKHSRLEPSFARCLAYAEVVMLFRLAKTANTTLLGHAQVQQSLNIRQRYALPRYDYTLRSHEFAWKCSEVARYLSRRTDSNSYECLVAAVVGFYYAVLAGDSESFQICKKAVLRCISVLCRQSRDAIASAHQRELHALFDVLLDKVNLCAHDVLIANCVDAALRPSRTSNERESYLADALNACGTARVIDESEATRCRWLEIKSYLDPNFDPLPGLAQIRAKNVIMRLPFATFNRINTHRRLQSPWDSTRDDVLRAIQQLNTVRNTNPRELSGDTWQSLETIAQRQHFWHLGIRPSSKLLLEECLSSWRKQHSADSGIVNSLTALLAVSAIHRSPTTFSLHLLHPRNPFLDSHELLDRETVAGLTFLFSVVREEVEQFGTAESQSWWKQLLRDLASSLDSDASKIVLLLAYEMRARGINVGHLHQQMTRNRTKNPQAALLLFDFESFTSV